MTMQDFNDTIRWIMQETGVSAEVALMALRHTHGNVFVARDLLASEVFRGQMLKEAREYGH